MNSDELTARLMDAGLLWEVVPGIIGLRGDALSLFREIEDRIRELLGAEGPEEWLVPSAIPIETLSRAEYFASFPQWLSVASHLTDEEDVLEHLATAPDPARAATGALAPVSAALPPAVCYHFYARLADSVVQEPRLLTAQATCWRHEGDRLRPLARGWAFTMREIVCIGSSDEVEDFRVRLIVTARRLASELGLGTGCRVELASDPFFAPTARGKALLQRVKSLKHELLLPIGGADLIAAVSFNNHETFFGEAFDIRLSDGAPASTACAAFGLERWLLAVLAGRVERSSSENYARGGTARSPGYDGSGTALPLDPERRSA